MKNNFKNIHFFLAIAFLFFSVFLYVFVYLEISKNAILAQDNITLWQTELKKRETIKSLDSFVKEAEADRESLESHFARGSVLVPFLNSIEGLAESVGATPEITSVGALEKEEVLMVGVKAEGDFESLYKFIMLLESSHYEIEFTSLDLNRPSRNLTESSPEWEMRANFKLLSFVK